MDRLLKKEELKAIFLKEYELENGCWYSGYTQKNGTIFAWNDLLSESWWNHAAIVEEKELNISKFITEAIHFFQQKKKKPAILIPSYIQNSSLAEAITQAGFSEEHKDAWMIYKKKKTTIPTPLGLTNKEVTTEEEKQIFADLFTRAHSGGPNEPYGKLPKEYTEVLLEFLQHPPKKKKAFNYLCFIKGKPAGYATVVCSGKFAGIYNVGTIPEYRKKGIASFLTYQAIADSTKAGAETIFLNTDQGSYNEKLYTKLGFVTQFSVKAFILS